MGLGLTRSVECLEIKPKGPRKKSGGPGQRPQLLPEPQLTNPRAASISHDIDLLLALLPLPIPAILQAF
jgi:hypothetical protein